MTSMLASVGGPEEAEIAISGGADIIDLKDARAGALGALGPDVIIEAVKAIAGRRPVSAVTGDLPAEPEAILAAARSVAATGVDYVKVGLYPGPGRADAIRALAPLAAETRLIGVMFADHGADLDLVDLLAGSGFAGAMLDTAGKAGGGLLDHMAPERLARFVGLCRANRLMAGLAGSLEAPDVPRLVALRPDVLGFRGALCRDHDRRSSLDPEAVAAIRRLIPAEVGQGRPDAGNLFLAARASSAADAGEPWQFDRVFVRDLVLPVSIGAYRREREAPQRVRFDVSVDVARSPAAGDRMDEVFSYDVIVDSIRALVGGRHVNLVETLAEEVAASLLDHPQVRTATVRVEKLDVGPGAVGVEIVRRRGEGKASLGGDIRGGKARP